MTAVVNGDSDDVHSAQPARFRGLGEHHDPSSWTLSRHNSGKITRLNI